MQKKLDIISLGPGRIDQLTVEAKQALLKAKKIYCRTLIPVLRYFVQKHKKIIITFEKFYKDPGLVLGTDRRRLYIRIAEFIVNEASVNEGIAYALPGSIVIAEDTTYLIYKLADAKGVKVNTILGISFIDVLLNCLPEKYKQYMSAQLALVLPGRLISTQFNGYFSYIIIQSKDLFNRYSSSTVKEVLSKYYPKDFKFLYIYPEFYPKNITYREKVIEFQASDIKRLQGKLKKMEGSIFIPSRLTNREKIYGQVLDNCAGWKNKNDSFSADLKFQESLAFLEIGRYDKALTLAQEALAHNPKNKKIHGIIGLCLVKCGKYQKAAGELRKAEKENPELAKTLDRLINIASFRGSGRKNV